MVSQVKDVSAPTLFLLEKRYQVSAGEDPFIEAAVGRRTRRGVDRAFDAFRSEAVAEDHLSRSIIAAIAQGPRRSLHRAACGLLMPSLGGVSDSQQAFDFVDLSEQ